MGIMRVIRVTTVHRMSNPADLRQDQHRLGEHSLVEEALLTHTVEAQRLCQLRNKDTTIAAILNKTQDMGEAVRCSHRVRHSLMNHPHADLWMMPEGLVVQVQVNSIHRSDLINTGDLLGHQLRDGRTWIVARHGRIHDSREGREDLGHRHHPISKDHADLPTVHYPLNRVLILSQAATVTIQTHCLLTRCLCAPD
jgi:hypothetical protein